MPNPLLLPTSYLLPEKKNLLAFSAGIDSSALFFLLIENHIPFDIAIVDYNIRTQSKQEVTHAQALANKYNLACHTVQAPKFETHFEANARKFRYNFFEALIQEHHYDNLLTAHQLNDQLEWMLMRLSKGAGLSELIGFKTVSERKNYTLVRPLLPYSKSELLTYLEEHGHPYFVDESNSDESFERNYFRKHFSDALIEKYHEGIKRSFDYLHRDKTLLKEGFETCFEAKELRIIKLNDLRYKSRAADITLKQLGYLLSAPQRQEIETKESLVIGGKWAVEMQDNLLYIAPYLQVDMPKTFKELCRIHKIPPKIRPYLFEENIAPSNIP